MNEWISVDDRLPESGQRVLVKVPQNPFNLEGIDISDFSKSISPNFGYDRIHQGKATHWMPLPEPPCKN